jgi:myosin heavy subunit
MELNQHVWLRRESSHWGWVPAVIVRKEEVGDSINLTLVNDRSIEASMMGHGGGGSNSNANYGSGQPRGSSLRRSGSQYFADEEDFQVVLKVDPEQLKTADHEDIKLRNLPTSFQLSGEDPEAGVLASPSTRVNSSIVGGVDDLIELTHLHEPAILHALRLRYDSDIIYTSTGPILIAINPFKPMDLYSEAIMEEYRLQGEVGSGPVVEQTPSKYNTPFKSTKKNTSSKRLSPHVYSTADDAYRQMIRGLENKSLMTQTPGRAQQRGQNSLMDLQHGTPTNQSILVSGESGAGKTVTTKIVLNYFAMLSKRRAEEGQRSTPSKSPKRTPDAAPGDNDVSIEQQVLQSNPILEAFGNARTIRNDNSSRFGKYIDISFNRSGKISGASIDTYLLEKVRLIRPNVGERNYHVFYQFLQSATARERQEFYIGNKSFRDFRLLSESGTFTRRDGVSDEENHFEMLDAMVRSSCVFCD